MQDKRKRILEILKEQGEATVASLARELGITSVTVRHHLDVLRAEGLVSEPQIHHRSSVGRPEYLYSLTREATSHFPKNYQGLATGMLASLKTQLDDTQLDAMFAGVADQMAAGLAAVPDETLPQRLDRVVTYLDERGYMARWEENDEGYVLHTSNCPYETLVRDHDELCDTDDHFIDRLIGRSVQRICHMRSGDESCAYFIPHLIAADLPEISAGDNIS